MANFDTITHLATPGAVCTAAKVRRLARRVTQIYDEALSSFGLTIGQFGVLNSLGRRNSIGVGALAEQLGSDASTVSRLLKPLESAGLIVIGPDLADRRAKAIRLTDAGYEARRAAAAGWTAAQAQMATALGDGRLAALRFIVDDSHAHLGP
jgi:DNA-binding MarR family transcriptional regulator